MSDDRSKPRQQTPRVPRNFLYTRLVPVAIGLLVVVLVVIMLAVIASLFMPVTGY